MSTTAISLDKTHPLQSLVKARETTDRLFQIVQRSWLYERPIAERHRIVFYIGHLEAFDANLLRRLDGGFVSKSPKLDTLFAFGIDPVDGGLPSDVASDWPRLEEVEDYVRETRGAVDELVTSRRFAETATEDGFASSVLLNVAVEHRLMHAETLAYMFHQLPYEVKSVPADYNEAIDPRRTVNTNLRVDVPSGIATLGVAPKSGVFGWDNEFPALDMLVPAFQIDKYMVTNGQFLEFMLAGGYTNEKLWKAEDWKWQEADHITKPVFWVKRGECWMYRGMFGEYPLPLDGPVYVSQAEATAFANWSNQVLPTEEQWHRAAYGTREAGQRAFPWGDGPVDENAGNFDFRRWEPAAVNADTNVSAFGAVGMLGNGWEWTSTPFGPLPGFQPFSFYPGYSANFFDGKHYVMKGGSARTAAPFLRRSFRNWFQPHYQYVYAGFRCVAKPE